MSQSIALDYNNNECDDFISDNRLVSMDFLNELYHCTTYCYKCNYTLHFEEVGFGAAKTVVARGSNDNCDYDSLFEKYHRKRGPFYLTNLRRELDVSKSEKLLLL